MDTRDALLATLRHLPDLSARHSFFEDAWVAACMAAALVGVPMLILRMARRGVPLVAPPGDRLVGVAAAPLGVAIAGCIAIACIYGDIAGTRALDAVFDPDVVRARIQAATACHELDEIGALNPGTSFDDAEGALIRRSCTTFESNRLAPPPRRPGGETNGIGTIA